MEITDVLIIGAGPAGMTAGIYALRSGKSVKIIEGKMIGGQATLTYEINNFPGFESISGMELSMLMHSQVEKLGAETIYETVTEFDFDKKVVKTDSGEYEYKSLILSMGASARHIGAKNEDRLIGRGVCYCAVCDGAFFKDQSVVLVGGGNSAVEDAIYLSKIAKNVTIINNTPDFNCQKTLRDELDKTILEQNNIKYFHDSVVEEICGEDRVTGIKYKNLKTDQNTQIEVDGIFIAIGRKPDTELLKDKLSLDKNGYILADENMHTSVDGVFTAGDIRVKGLRQIITACGDGAIAGTEASNYINKLK